MQIQVNTSNGVNNSEALDSWANGYLKDALARFDQDVSRVEVQLTDENSAKKGAADKRCMLEARMNGAEPLAVNHHGETQDEAFRGATQKLIHLLDHTLGKKGRHQHRDRMTIRREPDAVTPLAEPPV